jgi:RES domain-containing protein
MGVIYASLTYAGAMLECLAHAGIGRVPRTHVAVEIAIAEAVTVERHDDGSLPSGWDRADLREARAFGDAWLRERRSAVLVVPSVVARREGNVLINPQHPEFSGVAAGRPEPVVWAACSGAGRLRCKRVTARIGRQECQGRHAVKPPFVAAS